MITYTDLQAMQTSINETIRHEVGVMRDEARVAIRGVHKRIDDLSRSVDTANARGGQHEADLSELRAESEALCERLEIVEGTTGRHADSISRVDERLKIKAEKAENGDAVDGFTLTSKQKKTLAALIFGGILTIVGWFKSHQ